MAIYTLLALLPLAVSAYPKEAFRRQVNNDDPRFTNFIPPGPNDVRSPCPGLNSLANHGFIHHDGRNMTIAHLTEGLAAGMNVGADFTTAIGSAGLLAAPLDQLVDPLTAYFNLDQLSQHNFPIEHDGSLSRQDAYFGNPQPFYQPSWDQVLNVYGGVQKTSIELASKAHYVRQQDSKARNPEWTYGPREFILSYGETALYLQTMSDPVSGVANLDYVRQLFEQEKLPYNLGWRPSTEPITLNTLGTMIITQLYPANDEALPEGLEVITIGAVRDAFSGINPVTGLLGNVTGLLGL